MSQQQPEHYDEHYDGDIPPDPRVHDGLQEARALEEAKFLKVSRWKTIAIMILSVAVVAILAGGVVFFAKLNKIVDNQGDTITAIRETQQTGSPILKAVIEGNKFIKQCVGNPKSECAKKSAAKTADLLGVPPGPINQVGVYNAACAAALTQEGALGPDPQVNANRITACADSLVKANVSSD